MVLTDTPTRGTSSAGMLSDEGHRNLMNPGRSSWTVAQMLQAIGWVAGRTVPSAA